MGCRSTRQRVRGAAGSIRRALTAAELLLKTNVASHLAIGKRLEEAVQLAYGSIGLERAGQRQAAVPANQTGDCNGVPTHLGQTFHGSWILTRQTLSLARDHWIRPRHRLGQPRRVRISTIVIIGPQFVSPE